jgi:hypothetical protein
LLEDNCSHSSYIHSHLPGWIFEAQPDPITEKRGLDFSYVSKGGNDDPFVLSFCLSVCLSIFLPVQFYLFLPFYLCLSSLFFFGDISEFILSSILESTLSEFCDSVSRSLCQPQRGQLRAIGTAARRHNSAHRIASPPDFISCTISNLPLPYSSYFRSRIYMFDVAITLRC